MRVTVLGLATFLAAGIVSVCEGQDMKATPRFSETQIGFDSGASYNNYTLSVGGPNGFVARVESATGTPTIDLRRFGMFDDGPYSYHLSASSDEKVPVRTPLDNGRDSGPATSSRLKAVSISGGFLVKGGTIVKPDAAARENAARQK